MRSVWNCIIHLWPLLYPLHLFALLFWHLKQSSPVQGKTLTFPLQLPHMTPSLYADHPSQFCYWDAFPFIHQPLACDVGWQGAKWSQIPGFTSLLFPFSFVFSRLSFLLFSNLSFLTCHLSLSFVLFLALSLSL